MSNEESYTTKNVDIVFTGPKLKEIYDLDVSFSFVVPGVNRVHRGQTVEFTAIDTEVKLLFPDLDLLDPSSRPKGDFITIAEGESVSVIINPEAYNGAYAYAVITTANKGLAIGGSFPKFIVDNL